MMKIHFCDLCNESVPQADLDEGRALLRKGRVVCATCDRSMSHPGAEPAPSEVAPAADHAPAAQPLATAAGSPPTAFSSILAAEPRPESRPEPRQSSAALWVGVLAMAFTAAAIFVQNGRLEEAARENRATRQLGQRAQQELQASLQRARSEFASLAADSEKRLTALLDANHKDLNAELARWQSDQAKQLDEMREELKKGGDWRQKIDKQVADDQRRMDELSHLVAKGEDEARQLAEKMKTLEQAAKAPLPAPAVVAANEPPWKALIVDLTSANAGVRWEAVDGLGQARDPQAVPALLPMLKDPDVFVRMATARVLGDLKALTAVAGLLDALEDNEDAVREAAFVALRNIVGNKDLKFDPLAPEAERAKRLKALREWWKKEEDSGTGRG
jgi:hypothetical protein